MTDIPHTGYDRHNNVADAAKLNSNVLLGNGAQFSAVGVTQSTGVPR